MLLVVSVFFFALKRDQKGNIQRFKARLVAQGFKQKYGVDYFETSSPVMQRKTIRLLVALAVENGWEMSQVDVVGTYLNRSLYAKAYRGEV